MKDRNPNKDNDAALHAKIQAAAANRTVGIGPTSDNSEYHRWHNPAGELRSSAENLQAQAQKNHDGANFLEAHPEFNEFLMLIRTGAIQF